MKGIVPLGFFVLSLLLIPAACAYSIGISPDRLVFDGESARTFTILNPNDEEIMFEIENEYFDFSPQNGTIRAKASESITAKAIEDGPISPDILIKLKKDSAVVPGAVLKAEIKGKDKAGMDDYTFNWLLVFLSTIIFGFLGFALCVELLRWLRGR